MKVPEELTLNYGDYPWLGQTSSAKPLKGTELFLEKESPDITESTVAFPFLDLRFPACDGSFGCNREGSGLPVPFSSCLRAHRSQKCLLSQPLQLCKPIP